MKKCKPLVTATTTEPMETSSTAEVQQDTSSRKKQSKYYCDPCDLDLKSQFNFNRHLNTKRHRRNNSLQLTSDETEIINNDHRKLSEVRLESEAKTGGKNFFITFNRACKYSDSQFSTGISCS
ncbi:hypothetical protein ACF0H5_000658 [Mactra antiquata]